MKCGVALPPMKNEDEDKIDEACKSIGMRVIPDKPNQKVRSCCPSAQPFRRKCSCYSLVGKLALQIPN